MASGSRARGKGQQSKSSGHHLLRLLLPSALLAVLCSSALVPLILPGRSHHPLGISLGVLKRLRASVKRHVQALTGAVTVTVRGAVSVTGEAAIGGVVTAASQGLSRKWQPSLGKEENGTRKLYSRPELPHQHLRPLPEWAPVPGTFLLGFCHLNRWSNRLLCMQRALVLASLLNRTLVLPQADVCAEGGAEAEEGSLLIDIDHLRGCLEDSRGTPHAAAIPSVTNPSPSFPKLTARKAAVPKVVTLEELLAAYGVPSLQVDLLLCTGRGTYPAHCPPGECSAQGRVVYPSPTRPPLSLYDTSQLSVPRSAAAAEGAAPASASGAAADAAAEGRGPCDVSRRGLTSSQETGTTRRTSRAALTSPPGGGISAGAVVGTSDVSRGELTSPKGGLSAGAVVGTLARATRGAGVLSLGDLFYARVAGHDPEDWERAGSFPGFPGSLPGSFLGALFGSPCKLLLRPAPEVFSRAAWFMHAAGLGGGAQDGVDPAGQKGVGSSPPTYAAAHLRKGTFARYPKTAQEQPKNSPKTAQGQRLLESPRPLAYAAVHLRRGDFGAFCRPPRCHFWSIHEAAACLGRHLGASGLRRLFLSSDGNVSEVGELRGLLSRKGIQVLRMGITPGSYPQKPGGLDTSGNPADFGGSRGSGSRGGSGGSGVQGQHQQEGQEAGSEQQGLVTGVCSSPLACALVEKLVCAHATQLLWQDQSSFSAHILQLRRGLGSANPQLDRRLCAL